MNHEERDEARLSRLLRAVCAEADDRAWHRARARLEAQSELPRWLTWAVRPTALAAAAALLMVSAGTSLWWLQSENRQSVAEQLLAAGGAATASEFDVEAPASAASDSGVQP